LQIRRYLAAAGFLACAATLPLGPAAAGALYDMDMFLGETHPFDTGVQPTPALPAATRTQPQPAVPAASEPSMGTGVDMDAGSMMDADVQMASDGDGDRLGMRSDGNPGLYGISELRLGVLNHDEGPFSRNKEDDNPDINVEILFASPEFLDVIWSPRPHIGADINTGDDTSSYYFGLSWEWFLWRNLFAGFSLGGAFHDGETELAGRSDKKELGCSPLFRESVEMGWVFAEHHTVSLMLDHISNAKICDENEGLENFGIRYGYRF